MVVDPPLEAAATASFRLLDLPKEIRDLIYEKMLVREKIGIETVAIIGDDDETSPGIVAKAHHSRSVWSSPDYYGDEPKIMSFSLGAISRDNIYAYDTYQLIRGDSASKHGRERPYLHLYFANKQIHPYLHVFFANKQIYGEAQLTFYSKNTFAFTSVVACAAFLHDRSLETLRTIRSIKLGVEEYIFPMAGDESDALFRLQVHQMPLSDIINQQMALRDLAFHIRATVRFEYAGEDDETWDWAIRERVDYSTEKLFWIPEWVLEFSKIKNLDSLEVVWESDTPRLVGRSVRAVRQMRSAMVKNGGSRIYLRNEGIRVLMRRRHQGFRIDHRPSDRFMTVHMQADQHGRSNVRQREDALWDPELECCHCNRDEETDPCACQKELGAGKAVGATEQTHGTSSDVSASIQDTTEHGEGNGEDENGNEGDEQDNNGIGEDPDGLSVHGWEGR